MQMHEHIQAVFRQRLRAQLDEFQSTAQTANEAHTLMTAGLCLGTIHHLQLRAVLTPAEAAGYQIELRHTLAERWPDSLSLFDEMAQREVN